MRLTPPLVALLAAHVVFATDPKDPKSLDVPADKTAAAKALIAKLDDDNILVRDKATADLKAMGRDALPALQEAMKGKLPERARNSVDALLPGAKQADFEARAKVFLADKDRKYDHELLGWAELKAAVKDTKESRQLMADILGDEDCRAMLLLAFDTSEDGRKRFEKRWESKQREWQAVTRAELQAGLKTKGPWPKADAPIQWMPAALLADLVCGRDYYTGYRHSVVKAYLDHTDEAKLTLQGKGRYGQAVSGCIRYWIEHQQGRYGLTDASSISRYMKFDKEVTLSRVEKLFDMMVSTGQVNASIGQLAGTRDPKYIASFRRLFDSDKPFWSPREDNKIPEIQMRDAGLSMCIALSGQDPTEYGFTAQYKTKATDDMRYYPYTYYFEDGDGKSADDKRKAAFKKWAEWEKANPDATKAKPPEKKDK